MNAKTVLVAIAALAVGTFAGSALASETLQVGSAAAKNEMSECKANGGTTFPKKGANGTYGCIRGSGSGIVCGGVTTKQKQTCDTFKQIPPRLPTREEVEYAELAAKTRNQ